MMIDYENIGQVIRNYREQQDMTLEQLAELSNISLGYLSNIERGKRKPTLNTLFDIALSLGITTDDLFQNSSIRDPDLTKRLIFTLLDQFSQTEQLIILSMLQNLLNILTEKGIRL